ncbi:MAG: type IX secretion system membrane protein PorP/SprF [Crocinitomicaceae bacterium]|nr:type IX secretion system membrane protein PorP/SprF [Flavobacteriales bacterium]NQZ34849.1 type IX secretion system membrane protein PorP/SprF [Crocinitomicaceae bacterium]
MKALIFISTILIATTSWGQQDPMYTQFFSNKLVVNPAYAGTRDAFSALVLYRHQWAGFEGAPKTTTASIHSPIKKTNMGLGLSLVHDQLGIQRNYSAKLAYSYRLKTKIGTISLGVDGQIKKVDMLWMDSNPLEQNDTYIPYGNNSLWLPNFGGGIYLYKKNYYVGLSVPKLIENKMDFFESTATVENLQNRHFFAMAGVYFPISPSFGLKPAVLAKYEANSPLELDLNVMAIFNDRFWLGVTYRTSDSFDAIAQIHFDNGMRIGYAYDFTITQLARANSGSHEIMVGFDFNKKKQGIYNPRYF